MLGSLRFLIGGAANDSDLRDVSSKSYNVTIARNRAVDCISAHTNAIGRNYKEKRTSKKR